MRGCLPVEHSRFQYMIDMQLTFLDEMELVVVSEADLRAAGWSTYADLDHSPG
jgi:hypothetical protein